MVRDFFNRARLQIFRILSGKNDAYCLFYRINRIDDTTCTVGAQGQQSRLLSKIVSRRNR